MRLELPSSPRAIGTTIGLTISLALHRPWLWPAFQSAGFRDRTARRTPAGADIAHLGTADTNLRQFLASATEVVNSKFAQPRAPQT